MRLLMLLAATVLGGMAGHSTRRPIDRYFEKDPYKRLMCYAVGLLVMQPFVLLLDGMLHGIREDEERHVVSNLLAAAMFAIGVLLGYLQDLVGGE